MPEFRRVIRALPDHDAFRMIGRAQRFRRDAGVDAFDHEEVRLRRIDGDVKSGHAGDRLVNLGLVAPLTPVHLRHPLALHLQSRDRRALRYHVRAEVVRRRRRDALDHVGRCDQRADAQAGEAEPLGEAVDRDRALGIEARGEGMRIGEVAVRAIVDEVRADAPRDRGERLDLGRGVADTERVVRVDEIDDARALVHGRLEPRR